MTKKKPTLLERQRFNKHHRDWMRIRETSVPISNKRRNDEVFGSPMIENGVYK